MGDKVGITPLDYQWKCNVYQQYISLIYAIKCMCRGEWYSSPCLLMALFLLVLGHQQARCLLQRWLRYVQRFFYSSRPSDAHMCQQIKATSVQIMACRHFDANPLSKPMTDWCWLKIFLTEIHNLIERLLKFVPDGQTGNDNGMAPNRRQAITLTNVLNWGFVA